MWWTVDTYIRVDKTGFLGPRRKVMGHCGSVRMLPVKPFGIILLCAKDPILPNVHTVKIESQIF